MVRVFERYLSTAQRRRRPRAPALFTVSILVHVMLAALFLSWSALHVREASPPALMLTFFDAPAAPPPPPPRAAKPIPKGRTEPRSLETSTRMSSHEAKLARRSPTEEDPARDGEGDIEGGVEDGVPGGASGGEIGGEIGGRMGGEIGGAGTGEPGTGRPKNVRPHVLAQEKLSGEAPSLPPEVRNQHRGATLRVVVLMCIQTSGEVDRERTRIVSGVPGAHQAVLQAVYGWRYKPQPIPMCAPVNFDFTIVE